jgi:hypothetical protein
MKHHVVLTQHAGQLPRWKQCPEQPRASPRLTYCFPRIGNRAKLVRPLLGHGPHGLDDGELWHAREDEFPRAVDEIPSQLRTQLRFLIVHLPPRPRRTRPHTLTRPRRAGPMKVAAATPRATETLRHRDGPRSLALGRAPCQWPHGEKFRKLRKGLTVRPRPLRACRQTESVGP